MWQRIITGVLLFLFVISVLVLGGYIFAAVALLVCGLCVYEEQAAMKKGGHHPVPWPVFTALILCVPLMLYVRPLAIVPVLMLTCFLVIAVVMRRETPDLTDVMVSLLPLLTIVLPGLCLISLSSIAPRPMQALMTSMVFTVSIGSDTFALFVGTAVGGPKLCPKISPKKTVSGAIGGLIGATGLTALAGWIFPLCFPAVQFPAAVVRGADRADRRRYGAVRRYAGKPGQAVLQGQGFRLAVPGARRYDGPYGFHSFCIRRDLLLL